MLARVMVPSSVRVGEVFEIKVLLQHPMETGYRFDLLGSAVPQNVIHTLRVHYAGHLVFRAEMSTGISANPFLSFFTKAKDRGELELEWLDDRGQVGRLVQPILVI